MEDPSAVLWLRRSRSDATGVPWAGGTSRWVCWIVCLRNELVLGDGSPAAGAGKRDRQERGFWQSFVGESNLRIQIPKFQIQNPTHHFALQIGLRRPNDGKGRIWRTHMAGGSVLKCVSLFHGQWLEACHFVNVEHPRGGFPMSCATWTGVSKLPKRAACENPYRTPPWVLPP